MVTLMSSPANRQRLAILAAVALSSTAAAGIDLRLINAVRHGDVAALRVLLNQRVDPRTRQKDGSTALHWAAYRDDLESADLLIRAGADVNAANDLGATPLWPAVQNGNAALVRQLLDAGADPNAALTKGETIVMTAARSGNANVVQQLLEKGGNPNASAARGQTALMWAAAQRHPDVVQALLNHGADVHARTEVWTELVKTDPDQASHPDYQITIKQGGNTALMFAARVGDLPSARLLVAGGANVNDQSAYGISATVLAAHSNHDEIVAFLLQNGANPNAADGGYTALHAAILRGNERAVEALLEHGANPNALLLAPSPTRRESIDFFFHNTFVGASPFWLAARFSEPAIMRLLAKKGADPSFALDVEYPTGSYGSYGRVKEGPTTAMMAAVGMGGDINTGWSVPSIGEREALALEAVTIAAELGVDVNAANANGDTALHGATARDLESVVKYLVGRGANVAVKNKAGLTPLERPARVRPR
jgi:ankyrin repeat protein